MTTIIIQPFGSMREHMNEPLSLKIKEPTMESLREALTEKLPQAKDIIDLCAFGDHERIYDNDEILKDNSILSILPPVCGG